MVVRMGSPMDEGGHRDQDVGVYNERCIFGEPRTALGLTFLVCNMQGWTRKYLPV